MTSVVKLIIKICSNLKEPNKFCAFPGLKQMGDDFHKLNKNTT